MSALLEQAYGPVVARVTSSRGDQVYEVRMKHGRYVCSCKSFVFRGFCKHARQIETEGLTRPIEEHH